MTASKTAAKPKSYGEAVVAARKQIAQARIADPDEHFPYKLAAVMELIDADEPMPVDDAGDDDRAVQDYISPAIAECSADVVEAQKTYLEDPTDENRATYKAAEVALVEARQAHRANRRGMHIGGRAKRAGE